jgi:hypothetical protein
MPSGYGAQSIAKVLLGSAAGVGQTIIENLSNRKGDKS